MGEEKLLLTEAIAWRDLMDLKGSRVNPGTLVLLILTGACTALLAFFSVFMLQKNTAGWQPVLVLALALGLVTGVLYRRRQNAAKKVALQEMDIEAMSFDVDVCTNKYKEDDGDVGYNYYLAFAKAGLVDGANVTRIPGLPTYENVSVGDRFFTVSLRDDPKIVKYYSCNVWWLGEPQEK